MKKFVWGLVIGGVLAFLAGVNIGKDKPILSNPFADRPLSEQVRDTAGRIADEARKGAESAAERAGDTLEDVQRAGGEAAQDVQRSAAELADKAEKTVVGEPKSEEGTATESKPQQ